MVRAWVGLTCHCEKWAVRFFNVGHGIQCMIACTAFTICLLSYLTYNYLGVNMIL